MKASTTLAALAMAAVHTSAAPVLEARADEQIWEAEDGVGNVQISIGDGDIRFGHLVPSSTLDKIDEQCTETGCKPNADIGVDALFVNDRYGSEATITMQVEGSFNAGGDRGSKAQLLDLAKKAMQDVYDAGVAKREQGVIYQSEHCPAFNTLCESKY